VDRPGSLKAMVLASGLTGFLGLVGALITFAAGKSMLRTELLNAIGGKSPGGTAGSIISAAVDEAYKTLQTRAFLAVGISLVIAALAYLARSGRTGVRIGLTVALLAAVGIFLTNVRDGGVPGAIRGVEGLAMALALASVVLAWLPSTQRAGKAVRG
jgi:hypothetical protein